MGWKEITTREYGKEYFQKLQLFLKEEYRTKTIYPIKENVFRAFKLTPLSKVKTVILAQDPYHGPNQANGLAFAVNNKMDYPPSLINIKKEIKRDLNVDLQDRTLMPLAKQGVLLLNTVLTVRAGQPGSHQNLGWETFTDQIIKEINQKADPVVFMLWGSYAHKKARFLDDERHLVLTSSHPSPLSVYRGFDGCGHFSQANHFLKKNNREIINWDGKRIHV